MELGRIEINQVSKTKSSYSVINEIMNKLGIDVNGKRVRITKENNYYIVKEII